MACLLHSGADKAPCLDWADTCCSWKRCIFLQVLMDIITTAFRLSQRSRKTHKGFEQLHWPGLLVLYLLVLTNYINPQKQPFLYVKNNTLTTLTKCLSCFILIRYFASSAYWKALDSSRSCQSIKQQVSALTASENIKCIQLTEPLREWFFLCSFVLCKLCKLCNMFSSPYPVLLVVQWPNYISNFIMSQNIQLVHFTKCDLSQQSWLCLWYTREEEEEIIISLQQRPETEWGPKPKTDHNMGNRIMVSFEGEDEIQLTITALYFVCVYLGAIGKAHGQRWVKDPSNMTFLWMAQD